MMKKLNKFFWESDTPEFTVKSAFFVPHHLLMASRILSLAIMLFIYIWITREQGNIFLPMQFLTFWGVTFVGLYFAGICFCYIIYRDESKVNLSNFISFWKIIVVLGEFCFSIQILIPPYFWALLYPPDSGRYTGVAFWQTFCSHAVTPLLIYIETIFNRNRFYKKHIMFVILAALVYIAVNGIHTAVSGKPVYSNLNWKGVSTFLYIMGSLLVVVIGFGIGYGITYLKNRKKPAYQGIQTTTPAPEGILMKTPVLEGIQMTAPVPV